MPGCVLNLCSRSLTAITGVENRDYDWSKSFLEKFADDGHVSKVKEIELINDGKMIRAVVQKYYRRKRSRFHRTGWHRCK